MAGEKTEKATPKKLRDARKKGDVAKSRDITSTFGLIFTFGILWMLFGYASRESAWLLQRALAQLRRARDERAIGIGHA